MKYRLSTILLSITSLAAVIGLWSQRQYYERKLEFEVERRTTIDSLLASAWAFNSLYSQPELRENRSPEFLQSRKKILINNIISLYANEDLAVYEVLDEGPNWRHIRDQQSQVLREAGTALEILDISSAKQFRRTAVEFFRGRDDDYKRLLFTQNGDLVDDLKNFVERCLDFARNQRPVDDTPERTRVNGPSQPTDAK